MRLAWLTSFACSILFVVASASLSGCGIYFGGDDDCRETLDVPLGAGAELSVPAVGQRNPNSGQCEFFGGGYPYPCNDRCGPCPAYEQGAADIATPSWGFCDSECTGLGEADCQARSGCRAIYATAGQEFLECWSVDQTGPISTGNCAGLNAFECSRHDNCAAVHEAVCGSQGGCTVQQFDSCIEEPAACEGSCPPPNPGLCYAEATCDAATPACPAGTVPGVLDGCWTGFCIPLNQCETPPACSAVTAEPTCIARPDCEPLYVGVDCQCGPAGCDCLDWQFSSCRS